MKTIDQAIDDLALSDDYDERGPSQNIDYANRLMRLFTTDWRNGHTLVKARRDLLTAVDKARDFRARMALVEAKRERRAEVPQDLIDAKRRLDAVIYAEELRAGNLVFLQGQPVRTLDGKEVQP